MEDNFWKNRKNKTSIEKAAIRSLPLAKRLVFQNIPRKDILAIYVKGSMARREMTKESDVDIVVILRNENSLKKLISLSRKYDHLRPIISIGGYSLNELRRGKPSRFRDSRHMSPARSAKHLEHFKLIYGKKIDSKKLFQVEDKELLERMIKTFEKRFLPEYNQKKLSFAEIVKGVFWLVENEQRAKGLHPQYNWKKLKLSIKGPRHIIHKTWRYRNKKPSKDSPLRKEYIRDLEKYLAFLKKSSK